MDDFSTLLLCIIFIMVCMLFTHYFVELEGKIDKILERLDGAECDDCD